MRNPLRLKRHCSNCPFRNDENAIRLAPGRLRQIADALVSNDAAPFRCHKTVHYGDGTAWSPEGVYRERGDEAMCAGAAAYLMRIGRPTIEMRVGFISKLAEPGDWDEILDLTISPEDIRGD